MPKISIIVPIYNAEKHLDSCVVSILKQSFTDFELILIDDGSTDASRYICDKYKKDDVRVIVVHNSNHGVSFSRNIGLEMSKGDFVTFIDSDDYVGKDYLKNLYDNKSDLTISGHFCVDRKGDVLSKNEYLPIMFKTSNEIKWFEIFKGNMLHTPFAKLFNNHIIKAHHVNFDISLSCGEDTVFVVDYLKHVNSMNIISQLDYYYVLSENSNSLSSKPRADILDEVAYSKEYCINFVSNKCSEKADAIKNIYCSMIDWLCIGYLRSLLSNNTLNKKNKIVILDSFLKNKYMKAIVNNPTKYLHESDPITLSVKKNTPKAILLKYERVCLKNKFINWFSQEIFSKFPKSVKKYLKSLKKR